MSINSMKIGIVGLGFVGGTHKRAFEDAGLGDLLFVHEVKLGITSMQDVAFCDVVFMCLPSPTFAGQQDLSIIKGAFRELSEKGFKGVAVVKSTVLPGTCKFLAENYGVRVVHSPEFLRERCALQDFKEQRFVLLGGLPYDTLIVSNVYRALLAETSPECEVLEYEDASVTETAKYFHNTFLATKVAFANEMYDACAKLGLSYDQVLTATMTQGGIGGGHLAVPGPDGKRGFSGTCFPKDVEAFLSILPEMRILKVARIANEAIRPHDVFCKPL